MDDLLEELAADVDTDTVGSVTFSDLESILDTGSESPQASRRDDEWSVQHHADAPLTDDASTTMGRWVDSDQLHTVRDEIVTEYIDEILLLMIGMRNGACGKELLEDVRRVFNTDLSPGTVYPHLTDLADSGTIEVHRLRKSKVYKISDLEEVLTRVDRVADQLLLFSFVLRVALSDCKDNQHHRSSTNE